MNALEWVLVTILVLIDAGLPQALPAMLDNLWLWRMSRKHGHPIFWGGGPRG